MSDLQCILFDSGADAAVFPITFLDAGEQVYGESARLHDAQGRVIPVEGTRDVEVKLLDQHGKLVTLRERVSVSSQITQPILCYGKTLGSWMGNQLMSTNPVSFFWS